MLRFAFPRLATAATALLSGAFIASPGLAQDWEAGALGLAGRVAVADQYGGTLRLRACWSC